MKRSRFPCIERSPDSREKCVSYQINDPFKKKSKKKIMEKRVRIQGIEPWSVPWEGTMIPLHQMRFMSAFFPYYLLLKLL